MSPSHGKQGPIFTRARKGAVKVLCKCPYLDCGKLHFVYMGSKPPITPRVACEENLSVRYDPDACLYLCVWHHTGSPISAHGAPWKFQYDIIGAGVRTFEWTKNVKEKAREIIAMPKNDFRQLWKQKLLSEYLPYSRFGRPDNKAVGSQREG